MRMRLAAEMGRRWRNELGAAYPIPFKACWQTRAKDLALSRVFTFVSARHPSLPYMKFPSAQIPFFMPSSTAAFPQSSPWQ